MQIKIDMSAEDDAHAMFILRLILNMEDLQKMNFK